MALFFLPLSPSLFTFHCLQEFFDVLILCGVLLFLLLLYTFSCFFLWSNYGNAVVVVVVDGNVDGNMDVDVIADLDVDVDIKVNVDVDVDVDLYMDVDVDIDVDVDMNMDVVAFSSCIH